MKNVVAASALFLFIFTLSASSLDAQRQSAALTSPAPAMERVLADLERVSSATDIDISDLKGEKHDRNWKTSWMFWHHSSPRNPQADQMAASLQRNLHNAMPALIHDAQASGAFASTFKLYNNLSVVCETLDSLVAATKSEGRNSPLANDSTAMGRIRQQLAAQIELTAAALDGRGKAPYTWSAAAGSSNGGKVKKIVVDDTVPQKKAAKKPAVKPAAATDPQ